MKNAGWIAILCLTLAACNKQDEITRHDQYRDLIYRINTNDSGLKIQFYRAVYNDKQKGNISFDSVLIAPGFYQIPATVLTGTEARLFAESSVGGNFSLQISDDKGTVLAKTDSVNFVPANQLHDDYWYARLEIIP